MPPAFPVAAVSPGAILGLPHLQQPVKEADSSMVCPGCDARVNQMSSGFGATCPGGELGASKPWPSTAPTESALKTGRECQLLLEVNGEIRYMAANCLNKQPNLYCTILSFFFFSTSV